MALIGWVDPDQVRADQSTWPDADMLEGDALDRLLRAAHEQCAAYAPALDEDAAVPERYRTAQVLQARALFQRFRSGPGDDLDPAGGYQVRVYPLDATIRSLLRPRRGIGGLL